ncbi:MAG: dihydroneopterin aldolase [bacterium]|nr:dihydroneopterin aldolase [bacterium]
MSDSLRLEGIDVYAHHGAHPAERELGQRFVVDVEMQADLEAAAASDDLARGIDYAAVHGVVVAAATRGSFHLIESLAGCLCRELLAAFPAERVRVTVRKTQPPISGFFGHAQVTLERDRDWYAREAAAGRDGA